MEKPRVSVIIPFKNNHDEVVQVVEQILAQDYPEDRLEIICIDNGSDDQKTFSEDLKSRIRLLQENDHPNSPYSARNRGIEASNGDVVAFVDANSFIKSTDWLINGLRCLQIHKADMAAGKVSFDFGGKITAAGIADSLTSIQMEKAVNERGAAYTANLFIKKKLFTDLGLFEDGVRSGGDVRWTLNATNRGYKLIYCPDAEIFKKARSLKSYYRKKIRTGRGYYYTWKNESSRSPWYYNFLRSLKPGSYHIEKLNPERFRPEYHAKKPMVWFHLYLGRIVGQVAFLREYFRNRKFI